MKYIFCFIIILTHGPLSAYLSLADLQGHNLSVYNAIDIPKNCITFIEDKTRKCLYIVKQKNKKNGRFAKGRQFKMVREVFAARVAFLFGIKAQEVCFIPAGMSFMGKKDVDRPATLHTVVPGVSLHNSKYSHISLKQRAPKVKKHSNKEYGLSRRVINSMTYHHQFPIIVAYDTFTGDKGRHKNNLFILEKTDTCYLIDMDGALSYNLAELAYRQLKHIKKEGIATLSAHEIHALKQYADALRSFVATCPLETLRALFYDTCKQCHFGTDKGVATQDIVYIQWHKTILEQNYHSILDLIALLTSMGM